MSRHEDLPRSLEGQNDTGVRPMPSAGGDHRLAEHVETELRVTFEVDELTRFFDGFVELDAQDVYRLACEAA